MATGLTQRQREIAEFVGEKLRFSGTSPTIREIGQRFGIASPGGVREHIQALLKKGALRKIPGVSRGLRPADSVKGHGATGRDWELPNVSEVPILGEVVAGHPLLSERV